MIQFLRNLKIRTKLIIIILLMAVLFFSGGIMLLDNGLNRLTRRLGQQRVREEVTVLQRHLGEFEAELLAATKIIATTPHLAQAIADGDGAQINTLMGIENEGSQFDEIDIVDMSGNRLSPSIEIGQLADQGEDALITVALGGGEHTALTLETVDTGPELRLSAGVPVKNVAREIVGGIITSRTMDDDFLAALNFGRTQIHIILVYENAPVAHHIAHLSPDGNGVEELDSVSPDLIDNRAAVQALEGQVVILDDFVYLDTYDEEHSAAYMPLEIGDEIVSVAVVLFNLADLNAFEEQLNGTLPLIFALLSVGIIGGISLFARQSIIVPLSQLSRAAQQMMAGDLSARADYESADEIGQLATSMNGMAEQLQKTLIDLEERVLERTRELAQARDQAVIASQFKSELLAKVSHELRTPLNAILGYAEMLQWGIYGSTSHQQDKLFAEIIQSTKYLTTLVDELLDQAQLEAGQLRLSNVMFDPAALAQQVSDQMHHLARAKGLPLTVDVAADLPSPLLGDPRRLKQILSNLIGNAIKFTKTGSVSVRLYKTAPTQWAIEVSDTGLGIPPDSQSHIFEPFRQVDGSLTRQQGGTGLGLSIVKQLTILMGGNIQLKSDLNHGSTFTVTLPLHYRQDKDNGNSSPE